MDKNQNNIVSSLCNFGDWGLGQSPIPNPQSPIPNPHNSIENKNYQ